MKLEITRWEKLTNPVGTREATDWQSLMERLAKAGERAFRGGEQPGWSAATFRDDKRAKSGTERVWCLCLDFDKGDPIDVVRDRLAGYEWFLHTTRSHTEDHHRFRVVLPLSRTVSGFEYVALWARAARKFGSVDEAAKDPSRFWFTPSAPTSGALFHHECGVGQRLDVDAILELPDPAQRREPERRPRGNSADVRERAARYIARMPEAIAGQQGHVAAYRVAIQLVRGFDLSDQDALAIMESDYNPRCEPPWTRKELEHKIASARARGKMGFGEKLHGDPRDEVSREREPDLPYEPDPEELEAAMQDPPPMREPGDDTDDIRAEESRPKTPAEKWGVLSIRHCVQEVFAELLSGQRAIGATFGHYELDQIVGGIRPGDVTVFGAKTSVGKSS